MFVVDMHAPGVTVRPLRQMAGGSGFNEVFFDDVRIPDAERLGEPGEGWRVALTTLMNERVAIGGTGADMGVSVEGLVRHARDRLPALAPDRQVVARQAVGRAVVELLATRYTGYRRFTVLSQGGLPGPEASAGKLAGTAAARLAADAGVRLLGDDAVYAATADGDDTWQRAQAYLPGPGDRRRHRPGAAQHPRRAGAGPAAGTPGRQDGAVLRRRAMNFDLDTDQRDAAAGAREFFTGSASPAAARAALEGGRSSRGARRWPRSGSWASPSPRTPAARVARCSTSPSSPSRAVRCWPGRRW